MLAESRIPSPFSACFCEEKWQPADAATESKSLLSWGRQGDVFDNWLWFIAATNIVLVDLGRE